MAHLSTLSSPSSSSVSASVPLSSSSSSSWLLYNRMRNPILLNHPPRRRFLSSSLYFPLPRSRCTVFRTSELGMKKFCTVAAAAASDIAGEFTSPEIAKSFDFANEERIYKWWESRGYFKPCFDRGKDSFVVPMPPPNVTGSLHMGHAMFVTLEDIMVRYNRMKGRPTLWLPGTDHAGIATQLVVERMLEAEGIRRIDLGREEFTKRVWEWKEKYGGTITNQIKRLGASCDWSRERFTLDPELSRAVAEAFVRLHEKGLIYQGSYMVNWSPKLQTAVSDLEVEYSEEPGSLYYIKYRVAGGSRDDWLTIATTRPETLFGDTAVAVNPKDERYSKYIGKMAIVPLTFGRHVPIIADKYVDKDFGTGVLKISPGHDHNDYLLARKLGLPILTVMNKDGTLNEVAGLYSGLDRFEARKKVWSELELTGLAVKKEDHTLRVPRSQRGGEIIEPLISKQWFVTMEPLAEKALEAVKKGELTIMPERFEKIYNHWLSNIKDWCISRQLWWGHRIPVWYIVGEDPEEEYIVAKSGEEALNKAYQKYGKNVEIYQDPDVLDTWFSSALWPFSTLGWPDMSAEDLKQFYPTSVLETGHDILFFWVARMVMMGIEFTGTVPFRSVYLHGLIRDSQGRKMSKTLGNVIDPLDTIQEFGTDALRFTLSLGTAGQDLNLSTERLASNKAFTNKLWNAGKFILQNLSQNDISSRKALEAHKFDTEESVLQLPLAECWVVSKLHVLIDTVTASYEKYFFGDVARELYDFFWADFADWYIEASKASLYRSDSQSRVFIAQKVLVYVFRNILKLLHPFMPFVTEEVWQALPSEEEAIMISAWPSSSLPRSMESIKRFENLQALTRAIRNVRAEYSVEPAKKISATIVASPEVLEYISREKEILALLSRLDSVQIKFSEAIPGNANESVHVVASEGLEAYLPLADMVDISAEVERISKRLSKMEAEYAGIRARLSSSSFVEKAPMDIVQGVKEKEKELEEKLKLTRNRLSFLQSTVLVPK
ncbi:OLC1v1007835C1 [Oldenlandia corymbosa var. corymbosa]|uniref:valine--tRNA ligase n=1 Tax=Oldenlandia corymbosa var. corymbosa TaxID=529605 RepID=A0AAV1DMY4_OLDCO|nr:OLC1v1007835C1 [Oldenlandia corymbosa var. corymbosa]